MTKQWNQYSLLNNSQEGLTQRSSRYLCDADVLKIRVIITNLYNKEKIRVIRGKGSCCSRIVCSDWLHRFKNLSRHTGTLTPFPPAWVCVLRLGTLGRPLSAVCVARWTRSPCHIAFIFPLVFVPLEFRSLSNSPGSWKSRLSFSWPDSPCWHPSLA